jgi:hypothetical protein
MRLLLALAFVAAGLGCVAEPEALTVSIGGRRVSLPAREWRPVPNEVEYAKNFEAVTNRPPRQYQVLTVFLNQMSEDRKRGHAIAANEYLEVFLSSPNQVTVLLRRDHGAYWLLSREMFRDVRVDRVDLDRVRPLSEQERDEIVEVLRNEIDTTRHFLGQLVAR